MCARFVNLQIQTFIPRLTMKNYKITVETFDGLRTHWYEKSKAKKATDIICNRVYQQLCGLNIKEISVDLSV